MLSGNVALVSVENKVKLHEFYVEGELTCLMWSEEKKTESVNSPFASEREQLHYLKNSVILD